MIALFDAREPHHLAANAFLQGQVQPLITVEAVVVEVSFFLEGSQRRAFLSAVAAGALPVMAPEAHSHRRIAELASKYNDIAPDYADLDLIELAERTDLKAVLTQAVRDFTIYHIKGRKCFDLISWF